MGKKLKAGNILDSRKTQRKFSPSGEEAGGLDTWILHAPNSYSPTTETELAPDFVLLPNIDFWF